MNAPNFAFARYTGFLVVVLSFLPVSSKGEDWPHWTGPAGRNVSSEHPLPAKFNRKAMTNVKWAKRLGEVVFGCPTVADGKIYLNATRSFWILSAGKTKEVLFKSRGGSETAPIAANGVVFAFIRGQLYALDVSQSEGF